MAALTALPSITGLPGLVEEDRANNIFRVNRRAFTDPAILQQERARIFDKCWIYLGHGSEIPNNGDFVTRSVAGRELIFNRDRAGAAHAFLNACPHRGALVEREKRGNSISFKCFYHGWNFNVNGRFASRYTEGNYGSGHYEGGCADLKAVPHLDHYRNFYFINFDRDAKQSLADYLADAKGILDVVADQGEVNHQGMEVINGENEYFIGANYKLLAENSFDGFHAPETHSTYFEYLTDMGDLKVADFFAQNRGVVHNLGNGHACVENNSPWGRPMARWVPSWGEELRGVVEDQRQRLIKEFGQERGMRIAERSRNLVIFPNLVINDIMSITVRTFYPEAVDRMTINAWALGVKGESEGLRKHRLYNFLEFLGPGGFATPDDVEALEACQRGYRNMKEAEWNDISKGMPRGANPNTDDEEQMRCYWREWARRMAPEAIS
ncbi:MAG: Rieske 2Fe-2S domain-containing protein [Hyphomonadaceae bacterium]